MLRNRSDFSQLRLRALATAPDLDHVLDQAPAPCEKWPLNRFSQSFVCLNPLTTIHTLVICLA